MLITAFPNTFGLERRFLSTNSTVWPAFAYSTKTGLLSNIAYVRTSAEEYSSSYWPNE